jgi:hypothetical protein
MSTYRLLSLIATSCIIPQTFIITQEQMSTQTESHQTEHTHTQNNEHLFKKALVRRIIKQLNVIDLKLEEVAQATNYDSIKVKDKARVQNKIMTFRHYISRIKQYIIHNPDHAPLDDIIEINKEMIAHLNDAFEEGLHTLKPFAYEEAAIKKAPSHHYNDTKLLKNLKRSIDQADKVLISFLNKNHTFGQTKRTLETSYKKSKELISRYHIDTIAQKTATYGGLATLLIASTDDSRLSDSLKAYKQFILSPLYRKKDVQPERDHSDQPRPAKTVTEPTSLGSAWNICEKAKILGIERKPLFSLSIIGLFAPQIKKDAHDLYEFVTTQAGNQWARLVGEKEHHATKAVSSSVSLDDIVGCSDIKDAWLHTITMINRKSEFIKRGLFENKSYFIHGQTDTAELCAYALAGHMSRTITDKKTGVLTITGADLAKDKLSDIVKKEYGAGHLVVILKDLDVIAHKDHTSCEQIVSLERDIKSLKKDKDHNIVIIGTAEHKDAVHHTLLRHNVMNMDFHVSKPDKEQRTSYILSSFDKHTLNKDMFNIDRIIDKTDDMSFTDIDQIIKRAQEHAHIRQSSVEQQDFDVIL